MSEVAAAFAVFFILCGAAGAGCLVRPRLPEHHREKQTTELMHLVITMLLTFSGLALGLLISSAKTTYDAAYQDRQQYALELTNLDQCLRDYGPAANATRGLIHSYTAAVIASTWTDEPPPAGVTLPDMQAMPKTGESAVLANVMNTLGAQLISLTPATAAQTALLPNCETDLREVTHGRWAVIEDAQGTVSMPLYWIMVFWLTVIFMTFGLVAPRNALALLGIFLSAISLSLAVFVIDDLSRPYGGLFSIPSTEMRAALAQMLTK
jgi:hypothetical protein